MKVSKETIKAIERLGYYVWGDLGGFQFLEDDQDYNKATHLVISYVNEDDEWVRRLKAPKTKEVTLEWVMNKLNQESSYKNLYYYLKDYFSSIDIYATSYGVGVSTFCGHTKKAEDVAKKLNELGLKFKNEFSEGGWVYRFVISRDKHNLRILQSL